MSTIFKQIIDRDISADIVYEDDYVLAFLDVNPIRKGHTLVIPKEEYVDIFACDAVTLGRLMVVSQKIAQALMQAIGAKGINIHMNNGHEAGQDIFHAHIHVIPRFHRDEAFVIHQHEVYDVDEQNKLAEKIRTAVS